MRGLERPIGRVHVFLFFFSVQCLNDALLVRNYRVVEQARHSGILAPGFMLRSLELHAIPARGKP